MEAVSAPSSVQYSDKNIPPTITCHPPSDLTEKQGTSDPSSTPASSSLLPPSKNTTMASSSRRKTPPYVKNTLLLADHVARYLGNNFKKALWQPALTKQDLQEMHVSVKPLDLDGYNPTAKVQPIPRQQMEAWLQEQTPWERRGFGEGHTELDEWWNAKELCDDLTSYLIEGRTVYTPSMMYEHTEWRRWLHGRPAMRIYSEKLRYDVQNIFISEDESVAHTTVMVIQNLELPSTLSLVELFVLTNMTNLRILDGVLNHHQTIPVTVISIGVCKIRIIHGCMDGRTNRVDLLMSKTMDFEKPNGFKGEDWKRILCWAIANRLPAP